MRLALLAALLALSPRAQAANAALHTCAVDESPWDADAADDAAPLPPLEAVDSPGADCARAGLAVSDWPAEPRTGVLEARRRLVDRHHAAAAPRSDEDLVFVMLNGENEGAPFTWVEGCDGTLAARAARALAPSRALPARRLHLLTVSARPVAGARDVAASGALLHLLFEGETWVWPGVAPGFAWRVSGLALETVSLAPRVVKVAGLLNGSEIDAVIASGRGRMHRSPEKHYAPGFENYRTSTTAMLAGEHAHVRARAWAAARLPELAYVEHPQLLHYEPGQWYKQRERFARAAVAFSRDYMF